MRSRQQPASGAGAEEAWTLLLPPSETFFSEELEHVRRSTCSKEAVAWASRDMVSERDLDSSPPPDLTPADGSSILTPVLALPLHHYLQKAVIAHNYPLATSFYTRALHLSSGPLPAAALALGNLLAASSPSSSAPPLRAMDGSYGSKIKARREWESLNRAGACYLVGAAQEWKNLEQAAAVPGDAKGKVKEREDSFEKDVSSDGCRGPSRREAALSSLVGHLFTPWSSF